jgi:putative ABC transport system permease protein
MITTYIHEASRHLYAAKQRTLLALLGIVIGIGTVIAIVSIGIIFSEEFLRHYLESGTYVISIAKNSREEGSESAKISLQDALALPQHIEEIVSVVPVVDSHAYYRFRGENGGINFLGVTGSRFQELHRLTLKTGRFISELDQNQAYAVLGWALPNYREETFQGNLIGSRININDHFYTIIGVLKEAPESLVTPYSVNWVIIVPITTAQRHVGQTHIDSITAKMQPGVNYKRVTKAIEQYFARRVKDLIVEIEIGEDWIKQEKQQTRMLTLLLAAIGSMAILVSGVGIMNVMLTSIIERRQEIGILRAIGAKQRDIRRQFLTEALILSLVGGILGIGLGIGIAYLVAWFNEWQFILSKNAILLGVGVASGVGIFFGFYPAYKAAKLDPITALRSD